ncbi:NAD(P)-dependent oxidoreductase [Streptomyces sp. 2A115]|uniref:NAD(P)-dependent oxidoreductase n=1 Tax=Streptomyces sp. 2A115 TaxID=3457439 RepID=UPI003FD21AF6
MTAWLPYPPAEIPGLPGGISYQHWDGSHSLPGDPNDVRFLVGPPLPGAEHALSRVLPHAGNLEVLQLLSSGYDNMVPLLAAMPPGAQLATARGVHREATAELAVTLLLALMRGVDRFIGQQEQHTWKSRIWPTLAGKRVLVVGYGAVGTAVAARLHAFGCEVVPVARAERTSPTGRVYGAAVLPELLPTVDAVVLCAPLAKATRGMFGADSLALLKDGAVLVNTARGELVDTAAVVREVRIGRLRVALDVTDPEPLPAGHPLWNLSGALITPHVAAFTDAFRPTSMHFLRRQLHRYAAGEELENVIPITPEHWAGDQAA